VNFDLPTPFDDDWQEPLYIIAAVDNIHLFVARDEHGTIWADVTDRIAKEIIMDFIDASIWTTFAVLALCEAENISSGMLYMRFIIRDL